MALGQTFRDITKFAESISKCSRFILRPHQFSSPNQVQVRLMSACGSACENQSDTDAASLTKYIQRPNGNKIAYRVTKGSNPGVIFVPGFMSHMQGTKAKALEKYCLDKGLAYTRFDYQACGESEGDIMKMTLSDWKGDLMAVLDQATAGPQVIVGSSLGGWLMLLVALERPHRLHSLVGIATAADFAASPPPEIMKAIDQNGIVYIPSNDGADRVLTKAFVEDAKTHSLLAQEEIPITCPVRLIHGMLDDTVPHSTSLRVAEKLWSHDVDVILRKGGEHRLSQPGDIEVLFETLNGLIFGAHDVRDLAISAWHSFSLYKYPKIQGNNSTAKL